ncbi:MAG: amidohydrolase family protein [Planctomycetota bacterium]|nr:amidohydrolase family protein [Planctomycetota bacterium]
MELLIKHLRWKSRHDEGSGDLRLGQGRVLGTGQGLAPRNGERVLDGSGYLALPGLINSHEHMGLNLFARLGSPPYPNAYAWGQDIYKPAESPICDILDVPLADRLRWTALKSLVSGVTTVVHHDPYYAAIFDDSFPIKVLKEYAWSHSLGFGSADDLLSACHRAVPFMIHAGEGVDEVAGGEVEELARRGALFSRTVLVHALALSNAQIELLSRLRCSVVWCPSSNLHLFGRTAPVDQLLGRVPVALGTDSTLSGAPTMLDELGIAQATGLATAEQLLDMVTTGAAAIFGITDGRGTLAPGAPADLWLIPDRGHSAAESLLDARPFDVALVTVDGEPRLSCSGIADVLGLGPTNALVDGAPKWVSNAFTGLGERIQHTVGEALLASNPLWRRLSQRAA